jgi:uncharacterized membrane protein (UPF0182 family)
LRHAVTLSRLVVFVTALWLGRNAALHWMDWLLFQYGDDWPGQTLHLGRDSGFYVFRLPAWHLLLDTCWKMVTIMLLLTGLLSTVYSLTQLLARRRLPPSTTWRWTIVLAVLWFALRAAGFYLAQFDLVTAQHPNAAVPSGMNYTDWHIRLPLLYFAVALNLLMALGLLYTVVRARLLKVASHGLNRRPLPWRGLLACGLTVWLLPAGLNLILPGIVTRFVVSPDEAGRESPFIYNHLRATCAAWQLDEIAVQNGSVSPLKVVQDQYDVDFDINPLRIWDMAHLREALGSAEPVPSGQQLSALHLDRYDVDGHAKLNAIAAREAAVAGTSGGWLNQHVQYSYGEGIVACDATQSTSSGQPVILRDLPQFALPETPVFYGAANRTYALSEESIAGGVLLNSPLRRCAWAWRLRDINLLLYRGVSGGHLRLLFRRAMTERAVALAPFLKSGGEPYPVVANGRLVWMLDLLTATATYPAARANGGQPFNAARDSVKMVMDAADGRVTFYVATSETSTDPVLRAWRRALPELVRPYEEMPPAIRRHRRYPRLLFDARLHMLSRYHDESPQSFYTQRDVWSDGRETDQPDYALLPSWTERSRTSRFVLQDSLVSAAGRRLAGLLRVGCDEADYGQSALLRFMEPHNRPAGPRAMESAVESRLMRREPAASQSEPRFEMGPVLPVPLPGAASLGRVLFFAPIYTVRGDRAGESRSDVRLSQLAVMDATAPDATVGIGNNKQLALGQMGRAEQETMSAPNGTADEIAVLTTRALRLHNDAQKAAAEDWQRAGKLWRQERDVLQQLSILTRRRGDAPAR